MYGVEGSRLKASFAARPALERSSDALHRMLAEMQTRRSCKRARDEEHISEPEMPAVPQQAMVKVSPEEREQIRMRAHEIAESLHAAANALKQASNDNADALFEILQSAKVPFAIVSLSDRVLAGLYDPSQDGAVGPMPSAATTFEEVIAAEMAPVPVDGVVPFDRPLLHSAPCDASRGLPIVKEENEDETEEQNYDLGDAATARDAQNAIGGAEDDGEQEGNTASPRPNAQEEDENKKEKGNDRGRPPKMDDMVAYAVLIKVMHDPELVLEDAAAAAAAKWEQIEGRRKGGRKLQKKESRVLTASTLRKRVEKVAGDVWRALKNRESKEGVLNKIMEAFPAVYREYVSGVEGDITSNQSNGDWDIATKDAAQNNQHSGSRRHRRHHRGDAIEEEEEKEEEESDNRYGDLVTIKKEKFWPSPTLLKEEQEIEDEKNNFEPTWHDDNDEEVGEEIFPVKQEPSQNHGLQYGLYGTGCTSYDDLMMNSSPPPELDGSNVSDVFNGSPGICRPNGFVTTSLYPKRRQQEISQ
ncbi:hypothetical protein KSW81_002913 [Nannochloris sp. 'desiccata']|nr:hypothetical protein KSW81_002913 [Chlorella desiccata (nom. nud.)]